MCLCDFTFRLCSFRCNSRLQSESSHEWFRKKWWEGSHLRARKIFWRNWIWLAFARRSSGEKHRFFFFLTSVSQSRNSPALLLLFTLEHVYNVMLQYAGNSCEEEIIGSHTCIRPAPWRRPNSFFFPSSGIFTGYNTGERNGKIEMEKYRFLDYLSCFCTVLV